MNNKKPTKKEKSAMGKYFSIVFSILSIYAVAVVCFFTYAYFTDTSESKGGGIINGIVDKVSDAIEPKIPERTLALVAVTDIEEGRTDTIMLVDYNCINNKVTLMSIPRDTKVTVSQDVFNVMANNYPVLKSSTMKINAINYYGNERGMEFLSEYVEEMLDIEIDYTALLHIDAVRYLVDSVGGIEFDVPRRMYYSDPTQNLLINLQAGVQLLDGSSAEQLLRYRSYGDGDLSRVEVQQEFISLFLDKIFSMDSIISNPSSYLTALIDYVETNFKITDALRYLKEINKIDTSNVENYTMPVIMQQSSTYLLTDDSEIKSFAYDLFNKPTVAPEDIVYESSYHKSIQVLNGSNTSGIAKLTQDYLQDNGYLVSSIGDSTEEKVPETIIYVAQEGHGYDIAEFFENAKVIVNPVKVKTYGYDIVVIFGTNDSFITQDDNL